MGFFGHRLFLVLQLFMGFLLDDQPRRKAILEMALAFLALGDSSLRPKFLNQRIVGSSLPSVVQILPYGPGVRKSPCHPDCFSESSSNARFGYYLSACSCNRTWCSQVLHPARLAFQSILKRHSHHVLE